MTAAVYSAGKPRKASSGRAGHSTRYSDSRNKKKSSTGLRFVLLFAVMLFLLFFLLTSAQKTAASSEAMVARNKYYTCIYVNCGETLWQIAGRYATVEYSDYYDYIEEVMQINNLSSDRLKSGMKLCVPYYADEPIC